MPEQHPQLRLTFIGEGFRDGAVPLTVVASKLLALQLAMFHAAAAASGRERERRGLWFNKYRSMAELMFAKSHHSNLAIEARLTTNPLLAEDFDLGLRAVDLLFDAAVAAEGDKLDAFQDIGRLDRDYLLRSLEGLMPNQGDQYQVKLENCQPRKHPPVTFTPETRKRIKDFTARALRFDWEDDVTIVGELVKIHVDTGEDKVTVRYQHRDVDCFYGDALRDQISNLIAGSMVEVTGQATLSEANLINRMKVSDIQHVSMEPLRIARFEHSGRVFELASPIAVDVEYTEDLWIYSHGALNLWGYAARREDALKDLQENFAYLYREFAEEDASKLDAIAQQLRERLRKLVKRAEAAHA